MAPPGRCRESNRLVGGVDGDDIAYLVPPAAFDRSPVTATICRLLQTNLDITAAADSRDRMLIDSHSSRHGTSGKARVFRRALPLLVALALSGAPARAELILFDNLSAGSPNGSFGVSNTQWTAQSFSTTSSGFILSEVALRLWNQNGTSGNFEIQVWDALGTSGRPGAQVGAAVYTGLAQDLGNAEGSLLAVSGLNFTLAPDTAYYLMALGTGLADVPGYYTTPGTLYWDATNQQSSPAYSTSNGGASWNGPFAQNLYMKVTATAAPIPEPGTWVTAALLGGGAALIRWRKRKKVS